ncbi:MAG: hypothetical protein WCG63_05400 [Opitutaceae bacterium]
MLEKTLPRGRRFVSIRPMAQPAVKICTLANSKMLKIRAHAARLAEALNGIGGGQCPAEVSDAVSYLELCSGVKKITFNTFEFDHTMGLCETADDFRDEHDNLREALVHRLTLFLFSWAALESFVARAKLPSVKLPKGQTAGKIERLCGFLTSQFKGESIEEWPETINCLRCTIGRSELSKKLGVVGKLPQFVGPPAEGIHLVYKLRNSLAHGDFNVPWPDRDDKPVEAHPDVHLVGISTKIVLLTIQMLTLCYFDRTLNIEMCGLSIDHEDGLDIRTVFPRLHLSSFPDELDRPVASGEG